jgi:hypothetical protein
MRPPKSLVASVVSLAAVLTGCTDREDDSDEVVVDGKADGPSEVTIKLKLTSGKLRASESPKLAGAASGSTASFACPTDNRTPEGWRALCERGQERLTLIYGPDDRVGAAIYVKSTTSPDKRAFYHCSATTAAAGAWPSEVKCTAKQPKTTVGGQLISPFSSSIADVGIFNAHVVAEDASSGAKLVRGMKPFRDADFEDLQRLGVEAVLIFKRPTAATEVADEIDGLAPIGIPEAQVANVEFPWKDFGDFTTPCEMTVRSLKLLKTWFGGGKTTFFHCTVGEDRTGYLAGLYRLLTEQASVTTIFDQEMCQRGYSAGNPQKPAVAVANEVDADLTPLFLKMAFKIANGELTEATLDEAVCATDPASDPAFAAAQWKATAYRCLPSTRYRL